MNGPNPSKWHVGDEIEFQKADGWKWTLTIVGVTEAGEYQAMWWDGRPHLFYIMAEGLDALRITKRRTHTEESVSMWRHLLGLEGWPTKMEEVA
jgi:hypothetical protein